MQLLQKAYIVWHAGMLIENNHEGYRKSDLPVVYAESAGKAKQNTFDLDSYELPDGSKHGFTDIRVARAHPYDKLLLSDGQHITRAALKARNRKEQLHAERQKRVLSYPETARFYVQHGYVGNAASWWALGGAGYTCDLERAQQYTRTEVLQRFVRGREEDRIWEAEHVLAMRTYQVDTQRLNYEFAS